MNTTINLQAPSTSITLPIAKTKPPSSPKSPKLSIRRCKVTVKPGLFDKEEKETTVLNKVLNYVKTFIHGIAA